MKSNTLEGINIKELKQQVKKDKKEMKKLSINPSVKTVAITLTILLIFTLGGFAGAWVQRQFDAYVDQAVHEAVASQSKQ
jgi:hypothetical protein